MPSARIKGLIEDYILRRFRERGSTGDTPPALPLNGLLDCIAAILSDGHLTQADLEPTITAAEQLFEQYVRPFDIPGIGPVVERFVDDAMLASIRPTLTALFHRLLPA